MRLLLDEMLSPAIARELRLRGHDVEAIKGDPERETLSDPNVLDLARRERRAIVTNNVRDFRRLHQEAVAPGGPGHFGMVFLAASFRRTKADTGRLVVALEAELVEHPGERDLADGEAWLKAPPGEGHAV